MSPSSPLVGLFSHEKEALSNWLGNSALSRSETTQNPGLAVKLNEEISFHLFCHWKVPAECLDAAPSLAYSYPFVSDAQNFGHAYGERWGTISFSKWFEQKQLFLEMAPGE
jgi:hypothetical protein